MSPEKCKTIFVFIVHLSTEVHFVLKYCEGYLKRVLLVLFIHIQWNTHITHIRISSVQFSGSVMSWLFATPWTAARQAPLPITNSHEFTQTHVHWVNDTIQPSHPLSSPSPPAPNPSQHQGLFQWVNSSHQVAKVLEFQLQHQSFQGTPRTGLL